MMATTQLNNDGLCINVQINTGGAYLFDKTSPRLSIPLEIKHAVPPAAGLAFEIGTIGGSLRCRYTENQELLLDATPCPIEQQVEYGTGTIYLNFPLGVEMLNKLELIRGGTASLRFSLYLKVTARKLFILPKQANMPPGAPPMHLYLKGVICQGHDIPITIPRDQWLTSLENVGYGKTMVFEFPTAPLEPQASLSNAFNALTEAKRLHMHGFYDKAVGECRVALDKFWDERPKRLLDEWKSYMSEEEHKWLETAFTAIRRGCNAPHHNSRLGHDQIESLVFINMTTSLVAYISRLGVTEKIKKEEVAEV